jgi:putative NIF3 family GTP cyclohydrolase 1 type 2
MAMQPTRRQFLWGTAAAVLGARARASAASATVLTAGQVTDRVRDKLGLPWRETTTDGFKIGSADSPVGGIVTCVMATADVLKRAAAAGRNLVITQEPVFYTAGDDGGNRAADAVYLAKKALAEDGHLAVWRFAEHWNARRPSEPVSALANALGWSSYRVADGDGLYKVPDIRLDALIQHVRTRMHLRGGMRWIGRPDMPIKTVLLSPGTTDLASTIARMPRADVLIAGEPREWEAVPYVLDSGARKAILSVGRIVSLEPSAAACAAWIRSITPEVPVESIAVGDPYWSPLS